MGVQLIVSTKHGVLLTAVGEELAEAIGKLDFQLFSLANGVRSGFGDEAGTVRISITDGLGAIFVAPEVENFRRIHPNIQIHLKQPINMTDIFENQTDIMISFFPPTSSDLRFQPLGQMHFLPMASRDYIAKEGLPTPDNLEEHRFVQSEFYSARSGLWTSWLNACARGVLVHHCDHMFSYGMLVKSGVGIGLLGSYNVIEPTAVPLDLNIQVSVPIYIVSVGERLKSKSVWIVFEWLSSIFCTDNHWFAPELNLNVSPSIYDRGYRRLFNI